MLTVFGTVSVGVMLAAYWMEPRSKWFVLLFAGGSAATSAYSALVRAYPITAIEAIWAVVALARFLRRRVAEKAAVRRARDPK